MVSPINLQKSLKNRIYLVIQTLAGEASISISPEYITSLPVTGGKVPTKQQADRAAVGLGDRVTSTGGMIGRSDTNTTRRTTGPIGGATRGSSGMGGSGRY